jgi:hypothetical protein
MDYNAGVFFLPLLPLYLIYYFWIRRRAPKVAPIHCEYCGRVVAPGAVHWDNDYPFCDTSCAGRACERDYRK